MDWSSAAMFWSCSRFLWSCAGGLWSGLLGGAVLSRWRQHDEPQSQAAAPRVQERAPEVCSVMSPSHLAATRSVQRSIWFILKTLKVQYMWLWLICPQVHVEKSCFYVKVSLALYCWPCTSWMYKLFTLVVRVHALLGPSPPPPQPQDHNKRTK